MVILSLLTVVTVIFYSFEPDQGQLSIDQEMFAIEDTAGIDKIVITTDSFANVLEKTPEGSWMVNQKFRLDEGLRKVLLSVLNRVRVQRPVSNARVDQVVAQLRNDNVAVEIYSDGQLLMDFLTGGNRITNTSYFMQTETRQPYQVALPGYDSYVAGIFEISENDWRDRIVFNASPTSFTSVTYNYTIDSLEGFTIEYDGAFSLEGVENQDSEKILDLLSNMEFILADQYLDEGQRPTFDSLISRQPLWSLTLNKIGTTPVEIQFYNLKPIEGFLLGEINKSQLALFNYRRMRSIIVGLKDLTLNTGN